MRPIPSVLALVVTAMVALTPLQAHAAPPPPVIPDATGQGPRDDQLTAAQKKVVGYSKKMYKAAVYHSHHRLNYAKAMSAVGGTTKKATYRRQYAGGFWAAGGTITHISKAERKRVNKYKITSATVAANPNVTVQREGGTNCTGATKEAIYDLRDDGRGNTFLWYRQWLNSCDSVTLSRHMKWTAGICGALGMWYKPSLPLAWGVGGLIMLGRDEILDDITNSNLHAVWYTDKYHYMTSGSQ